MFLEVLVNYFYDSNFHAVSGIPQDTQICKILYALLKFTLLSPNILNPEESRWTLSYFLLEYELLPETYTCDTLINLNHFFFLGKKEEKARVMCKVQSPFIVMVLSWWSGESGWLIAVPILSKMCFEDIPLRWVSHSVI